MPPLLVILAVEALVASQGISFHFVWPFEVWLVFNLFQDLVHWFSEHSVNCLRSYRPQLSSKIPSGLVIVVAVRPSVNCLRSCRPQLSSKIPSGLVIVVAVRPKIPHLLRDNLTLPLSLLLDFLDSLVFINAVHKSTHTPHRLLGQGFSQIMLCGQVDHKGLYKPRHQNRHQSR